MFRPKYLILFTVVLVISACAQRMDEEAYQVITEEFIEDAAIYVHTHEDVEVDADFEGRAEEILEEVAQRYGYTADQYFTELEERPIYWSTLMQRIEQRVEQLITEDLEDVGREMEALPEETIEPDPEPGLDPHPDAY